MCSLPRRGLGPRPVGFTLVELLVVITIVGVLAALLIPVLGRARDAARRIACASQQRQLMVAINTYATDFENTAPSRSGADRLLWNSNMNDPPSGNAGMNGANLLLTDGYVNRAWRILVCPSRQRPGRYDRDDFWAMTPGGLWQPPWGPNSYNNMLVSSYALTGGSANILIDNGNNVDPLRYWTRLDRLPQEQAVLADAVIPNEATQSVSFIGYRQTNHWTSSGPAGGNVALADGSTAWKPYPEAWYNLGFPRPRRLPSEPARSYSLDRWGTDNHEPANRDFWFSSLDPVSSKRGRAATP